MAFFGKEYLIFCLNGCVKMLFSMLLRCLFWLPFILRGEEEPGESKMSRFSPSAVGWVTIGSTLLPCENEGKSTIVKVHATPHRFLKPFWKCNQQQSTWHNLFSYFTLRIDWYFLTKTFLFYRWANLKCFTLFLFSQIVKSFIFICFTLCF